MKIGVLKTDDVRKELVGEYGEYPEMFADLLRSQDPTLEFSTYEVQHGQYPAQIDEVDAYLITGSKTGVYDDKEWIPPNGLRAEATRPEKTYHWNLLWPPVDRSGTGWKGPQI